jgi:putative tricarboxylic transport membrane protein
MRKDLAGSAILLCVAVLYYAASVQIPASSLEDQVGPRALPAILALLLAMIALAIGLRAVVSSPASVTGEQEAEAPWLRAFGMLGIGALYILLASTIGYWPALVLLLVGVPLYEGMKFSWRVAAVALGGATFFWLLFVYVLGVQQPQGMLF